MKCNTPWCLHTSQMWDVEFRDTWWLDHNAEYFARWICYFDIVKKFLLRNNRHARYCIIPDNERWLFQHGVVIIYIYDIYVVYIYNMLIKRREKEEEGEREGKRKRCDVMRISSALDITGERWYRQISSTITVWCLTINRSALLDAPLEFASRFRNNISKLIASAPRRVATSEISTRE